MDGLNTYTTLPLLTLALSIVWVSIHLTHTFVCTLFTEIPCRSLPAKHLAVPSLTLPRCVIMSLSDRYSESLTKNVLMNSTKSKNYLYTHSDKTLHCHLCRPSLLIPAAKESAAGTTSPMIVLSGVDNWMAIALSHHHRRVESLIFQFPTREIFHHRDTTIQFFEFLMSLVNPHTQQPQDSLSSTDDFQLFVGTR